MITSTPDKVGMSSAELNRVNDLTTSYIDQGNLVGTISLVARRGEVVHFQCSGKMSLETGAPMQEDAIFRMYSMTKPVTAIAIMMLYEKGYFQLDTPVSTFIPEFKNLEVFTGGTVDDYSTVRPEREMNMKDLLTHTSGLSYGIFTDTPIDQMYKNANISADPNEDNVSDLVARIAQIPLQFSPGTKWCYSVSTDVLGHIVEVITGKPLNVFFKSEIFDPLGMVDTDFYVPAEKQDRFTTNYVHRVAVPVETAEAYPDKILFPYDDPKTGYFSQPPRKLMGGSGLVSTMSDYLKFTTMLLNKGRIGDYQLVLPQTVDLMTSNHLDGDLLSMSVKGFDKLVMPGAGYGLGLGVTIDPGKTNSLGNAGEYHWGGAAHTTFFVDPKEQLIGIFMTQVWPPMLYDTDLKFKNIVYQSIKHLE